MTKTVPESSSTPTCRKNKPFQAISSNNNNKRLKAASSGLFCTAASVLKKHHHGSNDNDDVHDDANGSKTYRFAGTGFQTAGSLLLLNGGNEASKGAGVPKKDSSSTTTTTTVPAKNNNNNTPSLHSRDNTSALLVDDASLPLLQQENLEQEEDPIKVETETSLPPRTFFLNLKIKGVNHHVDWREVLRQMLLQQSHATIRFQREPTNEHDSNAIQVFLVVPSLQDGSNSNNNNEIKEVKIGYVDRHQAEILAPLLDQGCIGIAVAMTAATAGTTVNLVRCFRTTLATRALLTSTTTNLEFVLSNQMGSLGTTIHGCLNGDDFAQRDWETSKASPYTLPGSVCLLPWDPSVVESVLLRGRPAAEKSAHGKLEHGWVTTNNASSSATTISADERSKACWPLSNDILSMLGLGGANNKEWWKETAGLLPPSEWIVHGAYDLIGDGPSSPLSLQSATQVQRVKEALDGAIHGVSNVWTDDALHDMKELMHSDYFWLNRKGESFIRAFGGPYVLGQKEDDLHVVLGAKHNKITARICRAHNLIYTAVHLEPPAAPGFNTIIFGMNLRGSGFHYHQDSISELEGKNAPLIPKQPVVTTVLYEKPTEDSGKECVFWKPLLNFKPRAKKSKPTGESSSSDDQQSALYLAARALPTVHGQVHVQRAGLQKVAQHGIFHTPTANYKDDTGGESENDQNDVAASHHQQQHGPRTGYRVAITARITHANATERIRPFLQEREVYKGVMGPEGNLTLPRRFQ